MAQPARVRIQGPRAPQRAACVIWTCSSCGSVVCRRQRARSYCGSDIPVGATVVRWGASSATGRCVRDAASRSGSTSGSGTSLRRSGRSRRPGCSRDLARCRWERFGTPRVPRRMGSLADEPLALSCDTTVCTESAKAPDAAQQLVLGKCGLWMASSRCLRSSQPDHRRTRATRPTTRGAPCASPLGSAPSTRRASLRAPHGSPRGPIQPSTLAVSVAANGAKAVDDRCASAEDRHVKLLACHSDRIKLVAELEEAPIGATPFRRAGYPVRSPDAALGLVRASIQFTGERLVACRSGCQPTTEEHQVAQQTRQPRHDRLSPVRRGPARALVYPERRPRAARVRSARSGDPGRGC